MGFREVLPQSVVSQETRAAHAAALERARARGGPGEAETHKVLAGGQIRARWKIEVTFLANRSSKNATPYGLQIWESGKALNGEGDALCFFCLDSDPDSNEGCRAVIPQDCIQGEFANCPKCGRVKKPEALTNLLGGKVTMDVLAAYLAKVFRERCNSDADVYLKFHKADIRYIAMQRAKGDAAASRLKGLHIYPLARIMKDLAAGADLTKRMKAFITS